MMCSLNAPLERDAPALSIVLTLKFLGIPFFLRYSWESGWDRLIWLAFLGYARLIIKCCAYGGIGRHATLRW